MTMTFTVLKPFGNSAVKTSIKPFINFKENKKCVYLDFDWQLL